MKITIDIDEINKISSVSLTPFYVYKNLNDEYTKILSQQNKKFLCGMQNACEQMAKELYSHMTKRPLHYKYLILTYEDAENCAKLYKQFADVWAKNVAVNEKKNSPEVMLKIDGKEIGTLGHKITSQLQTGGIVNAKNCNISCRYWNV